MASEVRTKTAEIVREDISGQGGTIVPVHETVFAGDEAILDPNSPLAVQIPEDSGADRSRIAVPLGETLASGHVEAKFGTAAAPLPVSSEAGDDQPSEYVRAVGDDSGAEHTPDLERVETPEVHNETEVVRTAEVTRDVEAESPASSKSE
jgi:hypothetical protein